MTNAAGKPKPAFFIAVLVVVAGLGALAYMRCKGKSDDKKTTTSDTTGSDGSSAAKPKGPATAEAEDGKPVPGLTAEKYDYEPSTTLSPVPATSSYKALGKP